MLHKEEEKPENHERWLISYADFITLLMVFFVVMYAMSQVDAAKFHDLAQSLNVALAGGSGFLDHQDGLIGPGGFTVINNGQTGDGTPNQNVGAGRDAELRSMRIIEQQLRTFFEDENISNDVTMKIDERGLVISVNDAILFDLGSAEINAKAEAELVQIGIALSKLDNYIRVEGHTDNLPIKTGRYGSNWELSSARSTNVLRLMSEKANVPPERLSAVGYGEYRPLADNSTPEGRAKNRRVDIILLSSRYDELERQPAEM